MLVLSPAKEPDRPRPTVLYGYGGFSIPMTPGYSAGLLAWVEAGGVYAIAQLRGGSEEGEQWHRDGMRDKKQNVFDDFHAAAERLVADGWTTTCAADHLRRVQRRPAGGCGADAATRPVRGRRVLGAAARHGALRAVRAGRDLVGRVRQRRRSPRSCSGCCPTRRTTWSGEGVDYPAVLFTVFDGDSRVDPMHARKMCAALQHATGGTRPVLLRRERDVGHGARALSRSVALTADTLSFAAWRTGLDVG